MATITGIDETDLAMLKDFERIGRFCLPKGEVSEMQRLIEKGERAIQAEEGDSDRQEGEGMEGDL